MWSPSIAPFHFNPKNGLMECRFIGSNTLILFSTHLWKMLAPQEGVSIMNSREIVFPPEDSFKFFSVENIMISSTAYKEAKEMFDEGLFSGFFPPPTFINDSIKCTSDTSDIEKYLRTDNTTPLYISLINFESQIPYELGKFSSIDANLQFNYLDWGDIANILFSKYLYQEISRFVQQSVIVKSYFGTLEVKNYDLLPHGSSLIIPLIMGISNLPLAQLDIFLKLPSKIYFLYFSPRLKLKEIDGWISVHEFNKLYAKSMTNNKNDIMIFPNVKPYPDYSYFSKPYLLFSLNFGRFNFLNGDSGIFAGETSNADCLICTLNYTPQTGNNFTDKFHNQILYLLQGSTYVVTNLAR